MLSEPDSKHEESIEGFTTTRWRTDGCRLTLVWQTQTAKVQSHHV